MTTDDAYDEPLLVRFSGGPLDGRTSQIFMSVLGGTVDLAEPNFCDAELERLDSPKSTKPQLFYRLLQFLQ